MSDNDNSQPEMWDDIGQLKKTVGWSMSQPPAALHQQLLSMFDEATSQALPRRHAAAQRTRERELLLLRNNDSGLHFVYTSEIADIAVQIDRGVVSGQVIPIVRPTPAAFVATVVDGPTGARSFEGDEAGNFRLPPLAPGSYRMLLDNTHLEIELELDVPEWQAL